MHVDKVRPSVLPYLPTGHNEHEEEPIVAYFPTGQIPEHVLFVRPDLLPK